MKVTLADYKKQHISNIHKAPPDNLKGLWRDVYFGFEWFTPIKDKIWKLTEFYTESTLHSVESLFYNIDDVLDIAALELKEMAKEGVAENQKLVMPDINDKNMVPDVVNSDYSEIGRIIVTHCPALILVSKMAQEFDKNDKEKTPEIKQLERSLGEQRVGTIKHYGNIRNYTQLSGDKSSQTGAKMIMSKDKAAEKLVHHGWRGPTVFRRKVWELAESWELNKPPQTKYDNMVLNIRAASNVAMSAVANEITRIINASTRYDDSKMADAIISAIDKSIDDEMTEFATGLTVKNLEVAGDDSPQLSYLQTLEIQPYCTALNPDLADGRFYDNTINGNFYQKEWQLLRKFLIDTVEVKYDSKMDKGSKNTYIFAASQFFTLNGLTLFAHHSKNLTFNGNITNTLPKLNPGLMQEITKKLESSDLREQDRKTLILMSDFIFDYQTLLEEVHIGMLQKLRDNKLSMPMLAENDRRSKAKWNSYDPVPEGHPKLDELQQIINKRKALLAIRKTYSLYGQHARNEEAKKAVPLAIAFLVGALAIDTGIATGASYIAGAAAGEAVSNEAIKAMQDILQGQFKSFIAACSNGNPITISLALCAVLGIIGPIIGACVGAELSGQFGDTREVAHLVYQRVKQELPNINVLIDTTR